MSKASFRLPTMLNEQLIDEAKERGITKTDVILECLEHKVSSASPQKLVRLQNVVNECCKVFGETNPELCESLRNEMNELWL